STGALSASRAVCILLLLHHHHYPHRCPRTLSARSRRQRARSWPLGASASSLHQVSKPTGSARSGPNSVGQEGDQGRRNGSTGGGGTRFELGSVTGFESCFEGRQMVQLVGEALETLEDSIDLTLRPLQLLRAHLGERAAQLIIDGDQAIDT